MTQYFITRNRSHLASLLKTIWHSCSHFQFGTSMLKVPELKLVFFKHAALTTVWKPDLCFRKIIFKEVFLPQQKLWAESDRSLFLTVPRNTTSLFSPTMEGSRTGYYAVPNAVFSPWTNLIEWNSKHFSHNFFKKYLLILCQDVPVSKRKLVMYTCTSCLNSSYYPCNKAFFLYAGWTNYSLRLLLTHHSKRKANRSDFYNY